MLGLLDGRKPPFDLTLALGSQVVGALGAKEEITPVGEFPDGPTT
jgi:hypothetical protein